MLQIETAACYYCRTMMSKRNQTGICLAGATLGMTRRRSENPCRMTIVHVAVRFETKSPFSITERCLSGRSKCWPSAVDREPTYVPALSEHFERPLCK